MAEFLKDPSAVLDYAVDWSAWMEDGDSISVSAWESPDGLPTELPNVDGTTATIWLSGGIPHHTYRVVNRITTTAGRVDDRTLQIRVVER